MFLGCHLAGGLASLKASIPGRLPTVCKAFSSSDEAYSVDVSVDVDVCQISFASWRAKKKLKNSAVVRRRAGAVKPRTIMASWTSWAAAAFVSSSQRSDFQGSFSAVRTNERTNEWSFGYLNERKENPGVRAKIKFAQVSTKLADPR